jgi:hypothetical protein
LHWQQADGSAGRSLQLGSEGRAVVDWRLDGDRVLVLSRGTRERIERVDPLTGQRETLADLPLGSVPERARLAVAAEGGVLLEVADTATADLMQAR